jgi:hypothetical protein
MPPSPSRSPGNSPPVWPPTAMRTIGVDLSVAPERTAVAAIEWEGAGARVGEPALGLEDDLTELILAPSRGWL